MNLQLRHLRLTMEANPSNPGLPGEPLDAEVTMDSDSSSTAQFQRLLESMKAGDETARAELLRWTGERLRHLTHRMLRHFPNVGRWEQTDDVLQNAMLRLYQTLGKLTPDSPRGFFALAATHIRRELIDLARHHCGPQGQGAHHATNAAVAGSGTALAPYERPEAREEPGSLAEWTEFHQQVEALPDEEREIISLLYYQELSQAEAAELLGISERTVKRRWQSARLLLHQLLGDGAGDR
jgi:RNA polymerase sigma-70 factor (ECF subfamily)